MYASHGSPCSTASLYGSLLGSPCSRRCHHGWRSRRRSRRPSPRSFMSRPRPSLRRTMSQARPASGTRELKRANRSRCSPSEPSVTGPDGPRSGRSDRTPSSTGRRARNGPNPGDSRAAGNSNCRHQRRPLARDVPSRPPTPVWRSRLASRAVWSSPATRTGPLPKTCSSLTSIVLRRRVRQPH